MARVIVSGGGNVSGSRTQYISSDKLIETEGKIRDIFSSDENNLSRTKANNVLSGGQGMPRDGEILELLVSPEDGVYSRLGGNTKERTAAFQKVVRDSLEKLWDEMGVTNVRYVAGIHLNTANPHAHILIWKGAQDAATGEPKILNSIPRSWVYGTKTEHGKIGKIFEESFNRFSVPTPPVFTPAIVPTKEVALPAKETNPARQERILNSLSEQRFIRPETVEALTDSGTLYANTRGGLTFVRRRNDGVTTGYVSEIGTSAPDDEGFYYIGDPNNAKHFVIAENPKELLSLIELTSERNLSNVCFVAADNRKAPTALTELLKTRANDTSLRVVWALNVERGGNQATENFNELQENIVAARAPEAATELNFYTYAPVSKFGNTTWHQQIIWREAPGFAAGLKTEVRRVISPEIDQSELEFDARYEKLSDEIFSRLFVESQGEEFIVFDKSTSTERGRYVWDVTDEGNRFTITSVAGVNASDNFDPEQIVLTDEIDVLSSIEDYSFQLKDQEFLNAIVVENAEAVAADSLAAVAQVFEATASEAGAEELTTASEVIDAPVKPTLTYKQVTDRLRAIPLEEVLSRLGIGLVRDVERYEDVYKDAGGSFKIKVTGEVWFDRYNDYGSRGSIDLVRHIQNVEFQDARAWLLDNFGADYAPSRIAAPKAIIESREPTEKVPLELPPRNQFNLEVVRSYLIEERAISTRTVDEFIEKNWIYANGYKSAVFLHRDLNQGEITGASWRATKGTKRQEVLGSDKNNGWFHIGNFETANRFVITESPIEALSYYELHRDARDLSDTLIISSSGNNVSKNLLGFIENKLGSKSELVIAYNNDDGGLRGYLGTLEKTGGFVLLKHKRGYLAGERETVDFTGTITHEFSSLPDWNEELKQRREDLATAADLEHVVEQVNQESEAPFYKIVVANKGERNTIFLDETTSENVDFVIRAIKGGFLGDYINPELPAASSVADFNAEIKKGDENVLWLSEAHLEGLRKTIEIHDRMIAERTPEMRDNFGKGIESFLRRADPNYTVKLNEEYSTSGIIAYGIKSIGSADEFVLFAPDAETANWTLGIDHYIEATPDSPPDSDFEANLLEGNLRDALNLIVETDRELIEANVFDEQVEEDSIGISAEALGSGDEEENFQLLDARSNLVTNAIDRLDGIFDDKGYLDFDLSEYRALMFTQPAIVVSMETETGEALREIAVVELIDNAVDGNYHVWEKVGAGEYDNNQNLNLEDVSAKLIEIYDGIIKTEETIQQGFDSPTDDTPPPAAEPAEDIDYGNLVEQEEVAPDNQAATAVSLNEKELAVFRAAAQQIIDSTGGQFGYLSDAETPDGMTRHEFAGYTGSLTAKGLIHVSDDEYKQLTLTAAGAENLRERGLFNDRSFETIDGGISEAVQPKEPAQTAEAADEDRETSVYQPAITIKNQIADHLRNIKWDENVVLQINQNENVQRPEVFVKLQINGVERDLAMVAKVPAGYIFQASDSKYAETGLDYETMLVNLKYEIQNANQNSQKLRLVNLEEVAARLGKTYADTANSLNRRLTEQGHNELEASVLIKREDDSVESWINIVQYNYPKVERNVIGRVTQGTDSFQYVVGEQENEVYDIETLAEHLIVAANGLSAEKTSKKIAHSPEDSLNAFVADFNEEYPEIGLTYGYIGNLTDTTDERLFGLYTKIKVKGAWREENAAFDGFSSREKLAGAVFNDNHVGTKFSAWLTGFDQTNTLNYEDVKDGLNRFTADTVKKIVSDAPKERLELVGIEIGDSESPDIIPQNFKTVKEFNDFIASAEKPNSPDTYYKTDFKITLSDGDTYAGTFHLGHNSAPTLEEHLAGHREWAKYLLEAHDGKTSSFSADQVKASAEAVEGTTLYLDVLTDGKGFQAQPRPQETRTVIEEKSDFGKLAALLPDEIKPLLDTQTGYATLRNKYFSSPVDVIKRPNQIELIFDLTSADVPGLTTSGPVGFTFTLDRDGQYKISSAEILYAKSDDPASDSCYFDYSSFEGESVKSFNDFWLDHMESGSFLTESRLIETNVQKVAAAAARKYEPRAIENKNFKTEEQNFISRKTVQEAHLSTLESKFYLYGDNLEEKGLGGQAAEMRGEPNSVGIPTKKSPSMKPDAFFTDAELIENRRAIDRAVAALAFFPNGSTIVAPESGLGTGLAKLKENAPQTLDYLRGKLERLSDEKIILRYAEEDFTDFEPISISADYASDYRLLGDTNSNRIYAADKEAYSRETFRAAEEFYNSHLGNYTTEELTDYARTVFDVGEPNWRKHFESALTEIENQPAAGVSEIPPVEVGLYESKMAGRPDYEDLPDNFTAEEVRADYFKETLGIARDIKNLEQIVAAEPQNKKQEAERKKAAGQLLNQRSQLSFNVNQSGEYFGAASEDYIKGVLLEQGFDFDAEYNLLDGGEQSKKAVESLEIQERAETETAALPERRNERLAASQKREAVQDEFTYPATEISRVPVSLPEELKPFANVAALVAFPDKTGTDAHIGYRLNINGEIYQHLPNLMDVSERRGKIALGEAADRIREILETKWEDAGRPVFAENAFKTGEMTTEMATAFALDAVEKFERATGGRYDFEPSKSVSRVLTTEDLEILDVWRTRTEKLGKNYVDLAEVFPAGMNNPGDFAVNATGRSVMTRLIHTGMAEVEPETGMVRTIEPLRAAAEVPIADVQAENQSVDGEVIESREAVEVASEGEATTGEVNLIEENTGAPNQAEAASVSEEEEQTDSAIAPSIPTIESNQIVWKARPVNITKLAEIPDKAGRGKAFELNQSLHTGAADFLNLLQKENSGKMPVEFDTEAAGSDALHFAAKRVRNQYAFTGEKDSDTRDLIEIAKELTFQQVIPRKLPQPADISERAETKDAEIIKETSAAVAATAETVESARVEIAEQENTVQSESQILEIEKGDPVKEKISNTAIGLLIPETIELSREERENYDEISGLLEEKGYQTIVLNDQSVAIKSYPSEMDIKDYRENFLAFVKNPAILENYNKIFEKEISGVAANIETVSSEELAVWEKPQIQTVSPEESQIVGEGINNSKTEENKNYRWTNAELHNATPLMRLRSNIQAIELLRSLRYEYRAPEPDEQEVLASFSGWGSMKAAFDPTADENSKWQAERETLKNLLSQSEYRAAESATLNSHFTSPKVVDALWQTAVQLGFKGGKVIEPSAGIGTVLGRVPDHLVDTTKFTAVEKDELTAQLLETLYSDATVKNSGYEDHRVPDGWYDLAIGNVPFGSYHVHDERYNKLNASIHDYFLVKSLDQVREGGVQILITSAFSLDKSDDTIRRRLAREGKLIGAMRLPSGAFKENAGTEVVTDVLIIQKKTTDERLKDLSDAEALELATARLTVAQKQFRDLNKALTKAEKADDTEKQVKIEIELEATKTEIATAENQIVEEQVKLELLYPNWLRIGKTTDAETGNQIEVNQYFIENPEMILGNLKLGRGLYGEGEMTVEMTEDFSDRIAATIASLPAGIVTDRLHTEDDTLLDRIVTDERIRHGAIKVENGRIYRAEKQSYGAIVFIEDTEAKPATIVRTERILNIRDSLREVIDADLQGAPPFATAELRSNLNRSYDSFVKDYGVIHLPANQKLISEDPDLSRLLSLEDYDKDTRRAEKAAIFTESTITPYVPPNRAENISEAVGITLNEYGRIHLPRVVYLLKRERETTGSAYARIEDEFISSGLVFHDPEKNEWIVRDEYLAGNVRDKHNAALIAASENSARYKTNAEELLKVIPADIDYTEIDAELGVTWLERDDVHEFIAQLVNGEKDDFDVTYTPRNGSWTADYTQLGKRHSYTPMTTEILGTNRMNMVDIVQNLLDGRRIAVYDTVKVDKSEKQILNVEQTDAANAKARDIQENFRDWVWADDSRRARLSRKYNDLFNSTLPVKYDGSHLTFPGMAKEINGKPFELRRNQKDAIWRSIRTGTVLYGHEAGGGKTYLMIASAMKMKQLGLVSKPTIAALKANVRDITKDARDLYPGIRLLSTDGQFDTKSRKETVARISTNNFDLVIMTHDHLDRLPMKPETRARHINEQLAELRYVIVQSSENKSQKRLMQRLKSAEENLETRLKDVLTKTKDESYFEETGIDALFVDEIHYYKSLPVYSMNTDIKGIPSTASDRAMNMFARAHYLQERSGGRNFYGATGTFITNTVAELYIWQKFFQREKLQEKGIDNFDAWMHQFARTVTKLERTATGAYKQVTRLSEFTNVPELVAMSGEFIDVFNIKSLPEIKRPKVEFEIIKTDLSDDQRAFIHELQYRAENLKRGESDNMLAISTDARKLSLDERLVMRYLDDRPDSKVNLLVEKVLEFHREKDWRTQMIFAEMGVHDVVFPDIIKKLVENGIPRDKILNFPTLTDTQRRTAVERLKTGDALVALGSTKTLGTGVNAQDKLYAIHNLDTHWIPAYDEQRRKRMERDGNVHYELGEAVKSVYYLTEGGFDEIMYQANARKDAFIKTIVNAEGDPRKVHFRKMQEATGEELSYEEIAAVASGNPLILQQLERQKEVEELGRAEKRHRASQLRLKDDVKLMNLKIEGNGERIENLKSDYMVFERANAAQEAAAAANKEHNHRLKTEYNEWRAAGREAVEAGTLPKEAFAAESLLRDTAVKAAQLPESAFLAKVAGKTSTTRAEAAADLKATMPRVLQGGKVGEYKGFDLEAQVSQWFGENRLNLAMKGASGLRYEISYATEEGVFQSMESVMRAIPRAVEKFEDEIVVAGKNLERINSEIGKPFKDKERFLEAQRKLDDINFEIEIYASSDEEKEIRRAEREGRIIETKADEESTSAVATLETESAGEDDRTARPESPDATIANFVEFYNQYYPGKLSYANYTENAAQPPQDVHYLTTTISAGTDWDTTTAHFGNFLSARDLADAILEENRIDGWMQQAAAAAAAVDNTPEVNDFLRLVADREALPGKEFAALKIIAGMSDRSWTEIISPETASDAVPIEEGMKIVASGQTLLADKWEDPETGTQNSKEFLDYHLDKGFGTLITHLEEGGEIRYSLRNTAEKKEVALNLNGSTEAALEYLDSFVDEKRFTTPISRQTKENLSAAYAELQKLSQIKIPDSILPFATQARGFDAPEGFAEFLTENKPVNMSSGNGTKDVPALEAVSAVVRSHGFETIEDFWRKANEDKVAAEITERIAKLESFIIEEREYVKNEYGGSLAKTDDSDQLEEKSKSLKNLTLAEYWWSIEAKADSNGRVFVNPGGYEFIRQTIQTINPNQEKFVGLFNDPEMTDKITEHLDRLARENPDYRSTIGRVADTIKKASADASGTVTFIADSNAIAHEDFHASSFIASRGKSLEERHARFDELIESDVYQKAKPVLVAKHKTTNDGLCLEELANEFANGNYAKYNATDADRKEFIKLWFTSFSEKNGIPTKEEFKELNNESKRIRNEAYSAVAVEIVSGRLREAESAAGTVDARTSTRTGGDERKLGESDGREAGKQVGGSGGEPETLADLGRELKERRFEAHLHSFAQLADETESPKSEEKAELKVGDSISVRGGHTGTVLDFSKDHKGNPFILYKNDGNNNDEWITPDMIKPPATGSEPLKAGELKASTENKPLTEADKLQELARLLKDAADKKLTFTMPNGNIIHVLEETDWERNRIEKTVTKPSVYAFMETNPNKQVATGENFTERMDEIFKLVGISAGGDNAPRTVKGRPDGIDGYVAADLEDVLSYVREITKAAEENARVEAQENQKAFENRAREIKENKLVEIRGKLGIASAPPSDVQDSESAKFSELSRLLNIAYENKDIYGNRQETVLPNGNIVKVGEWSKFKSGQPGEQAGFSNTNPELPAYTLSERNPNNLISYRTENGADSEPEIVAHYTIDFNEDNRAVMTRQRSGSDEKEPVKLDAVLAYVKTVTDIIGNNRNETLDKNLSSFNERAEEIKTQNKESLREILGKAIAKKESLISPPVAAPEEISPNNLPASLAEEIRRRHHLRDAEFQFAEWQKDKKILRVEIARAGDQGEVSKLSIADLDREARVAAKAQTVKTDESGVLRLKAFEEKRSYEDVRADVYKANLKTAKDAQSSEREQIDRILTETANKKQLDIAARETKWIQMAGQTETLQNSIGEAAKFIEAKFAPEEIWRLQEKAGFRGDEEGFFELEAAHREKQLPRSQEALARLQGIGSVAEVNARVERQSYKEWSEKHSDEEAVTIRLESANGKIRVLEISRKEASEQETDAQKASKSFAESGKAARNEAFKSLAQPISNKINPFSPIQGTLSWLTDPAATLNNHLNPLQVIKNDPGVQVIRAVVDYVKYADKSFKQDALSKAAVETAEEFSQIIKPQISEKLAEVGRVRLEATEKTEKFVETVKNALDFEARIRTDLSIDSEVAAENLEIPQETFRLKDFKKMGDQAIELRDKTLLEEYTEALGDRELARDLGETESRVLTRSVKADVKLAEEARSIIASVRQVGENEIEIEVKLSNLSRFEEASDVAKVASDALLEISPETIPFFTAKEEFALRAGINDLDTRTAINLSRVLETPESAIESIENLTRAMTAEAAPQMIPYDKMTPQLQELYREGLEINQGLQEITNALKTQSVLDAQAQMAFQQQAADAANGLQALISTEQPPAYTLSHPIMEMKMEERETLERLAREAEHGRVSEAVNDAELKESVEELEEVEEVEAVEEAEEIAALLG